MQFSIDVAFKPFARLYRWMTDNPIWLANSARLLDGLHIAAPQVILDLGAGPGNSAQALGQSYPSAHLIALDLSWPMLLLAQKRSQLQRCSAYLSPLQANVFAIPLADASVDAVTGHSFLYLLPDLPLALAEIYRVMKPGGAVAFLEPHAGHVRWDWLWRQSSLPFVLSIVLWRIYSRLHRRFHQAELKTQLQQAGFQTVHTEVTLGNFALFGRAQKPKSR